MILSAFLSDTLCGCSRSNIISISSSCCILLFYTDSVDEASVNGSTDVVFNKPVAYYVNGYIDFPVGSAVPTGKIISFSLFSTLLYGVYVVFM